MSDRTNIAYFVLAGQSNMGGWFTDPSILETFRTRFLQRNPQYTDVEFFDATRGGSAMLRGSAALRPGPNNNWYDEETGTDGPTLSLFASDLAAWAEGKSILGIIWSQGEADTAYVRDDARSLDYAEGLDYVIQRLMELSGAPSVYIQAFGDRSVYSDRLHAGTDLIHAIQQQFSDERPWAHLSTATYDLDLVDTVHLSSIAYRIAAMRMADAISTGVQSPVAEFGTISADGIIYISIDLHASQSLSALYSLDAFRLFDGDGRHMAISRLEVDGESGVLTITPSASIAGAILQYASGQFSFSLGAGDFLYAGGATGVLPVQPFNLSLVASNVAISGGNGSYRFDGSLTSDWIVGFGSTDTLFGYTGSDRLDGGAGADRMYGGTGNDIYVVDNVRDTVTEAVGEGTDRVDASASFALSASVENLTLTGTAAISGTGNDLANIIVGNSGANELYGRDGDDRLYGGDGDDTLTGGAGSDTFRGTAAGLNGDTITDFTIGDRIVINNASLAGFTYSLTGSTLTYSGGSLTLSGGVTGMVASAAAEGGVQLTLSSEPPPPPPPPPPPVIRAKLILTEAGQDFTIGGNVTIFGNTSGGEVIEVIRGDIMLDASFNIGADTVVLPGAAGSYTATLSGSFVTIAGGDISIAIPVGLAGLAVQFADSTRTLRFDTASGQVVLGTQPVNSTTQLMAASGPPLVDAAEVGPESRAKLILTEPGQDIDIGGNVAIFGTSAPGEVITVLDGTIMLDASFNTGGDTVALPGNAASYTATLSGSFVTIAGGDISIAIPVGIAGLTVDFADADRTLRYDTTSGQVVLGGQAIGTVTEPVEPSAQASMSLLVDDDGADKAASRGQSLAFSLDDLVKSHEELDFDWLAQSDSYRPIDLAGGTELQRIELIESFHFG